MNRNFLSRLAASRTRSSALRALSRLCVRHALRSSGFPLATALPSTSSAAGPPALFGGFSGVGSEEAHSVPLALASVRRTNWTCSFPASSFHEDALC